MYIMYLYSYIYIYICESTVDDSSVVAQCPKFNIDPCRTATRGSRLPTL